MKRFGLRALAGTLATLMVVSAFGPAKAASAADTLLIAPNPNALKTLYITEDMVDEDGEIVISGGSYDRVVVSKEVAAKDIYFDQVTVGEMVVESGGESRIQLWEVEAEQLTVQEPELEALSLMDIKDLLKDEETRDIALQMYKESKEKDAKTKKTAPKIVTKEDAQVETLVARANATLDLADGEVGVVALEGSEKVDRAKVTLKNYSGDVTYKGSEGKSNMTLNNVDSRIKNLKVEESDANDYFAVNARNSVVLNAEVAGNARVALNALTGTLNVTEDATAANITLLNTIEEMNIAGDNAVIDVATCGRVETAAITGDKANVSGSGSLVAVEITGSGAYVSTYGTDVEGENTYVPPVYVPPVEDITYNFTSLSPQGWNNEKLDSTDGGVKYSLNPEWGGEVFYVLPQAIDAAKYKEVRIKVKVDSDSPDALRIKLTAEGADKDSWGNPVEFVMKEYASGSGEVELVIPLDVYVGKIIDQVRFQSTEKGTVATFYSVTFVVREDGPASPVVPPTDGTECALTPWEVVLYTGVDFRNYAGTTVKITAEATRRGGSTGPKAQRQFNDSSWTEIEKNSHIEIGTEWTDFGAESFVVPESWAKEPNPVYYGIRTVSGEEYIGYLIYHKGFSVEVLDGEAPTPEPEPEPDSEPVIPEGAYTFDKVVEAKVGWNASMELNEDKGVVVTYTGAYSQAFFKIPDDVDITKLESITLNGVKGGKYQIRLLTSSQLDTYDGSNAIEGDWGSATISTDGNTDIKYFVLVSEAAQTLVVDSVSFKLGAGSTEENPDDGDDDQSGSGEGTGGETTGPTNLIVNGDFAKQNEGWAPAINATAAAEVDWSNNKATFTITNPGTVNWHLQLLQNDIALENGKTYKVSMKLKSSADRTITWGFCDPSNDYAYYGGQSLELIADVEKVVTANLVVTQVTSETVQFQLTMAPNGENDVIPTTTHTVEISEVSVVELETAEPVTYTFSDMEKVSADAEVTECTVDSNGALKATYSAQYKSVVYRLPEAMDTETYASAVITYTTEGDGEVTFKLWQVGESGNESNGWNSAVIKYNQKTAYGPTTTLDLSVATAAIERIEINSASNELAVTVNSITFK